jgi:hypothetical protein
VGVAAAVWRLGTVGARKPPPRPRPSAGPNGAYEYTAIKGNPKEIPAIGEIVQAAPHITLATLAVEPAMGAF